MLYDETWRGEEEAKKKRHHGIITINKMTIRFCCGFRAIRSFFFFFFLHTEQSTVYHLIYISSVVAVYFFSFATFLHGHSIKAANISLVRKTCLQPEERIKIIIIITNLSKNISNWDLDFFLLLFTWMHWMVKGSFLFEQKENKISFFFRWLSRFFFVDGQITIDRMNSQPFFSIS